MNLCITLTSGKALHLEKKCAYFCKTCLNLITVYCFDNKEIVLKINRQI